MLPTGKVTIERHGTGERVQYFVSNNPEEAFDHSVLIHPGDKVLVPKAPVAYMLGDVTKPGGYAFTNNKSQLTALQMLALAGGTPPTAQSRGRPDLFAGTGTATPKSRSS